MTAFAGQFEQGIGYTLIVAMQALSYFWHKKLDSIAKIEYTLIIAMQALANKAVR